MPESARVLQTIAVLLGTIAIGVLHSWSYISTSYEITPEELAERVPALRVVT
jgi:hypothetical protein